MAGISSKALEFGLVVGVKVSKKDKIAEINVSSSINDNNIENYVYSLLSKMTEWQTAVVDSRKVESNIFFTILIYSNQFIIPTDYLFHSKRKDGLQNIMFNNGLD